MKKILFTLLVAGLFGCSGRKSIITTGLEGKSMPSFDLLLADTTIHFNTSSIPAGKPVVLFFFQPWCPYCNAQTTAMLKHIETVKDIHFYMLTTSSYKLFKQFYDKYGLKKYNNITAGIDTSSFYSTYYHAQGVPYQVIYDKDRKLKKVLIGRSDMSLIKDIALE